MDSNPTSNAAMPASSKHIIKANKACKLPKLKQSKLVISGQQSLSQVKDTGCKEDSNSSASSPLFSVTEEKNCLLETSKSRAKKLDILKLGIFEVRKDPHMSNALNNSDSNNFGGEEDIDDYLDDWEAIADALASKEKLQSPLIDPPVGLKTITPVDLVLPSDNCGAQTNSRAWRPDDTCRPQCLPNLLKLDAINSTCETITCAWKKFMPWPTSCPICYEDFDLTDSSFLPCPCGFRLCLFCHKRILEADERCPGCRKPYEVMKGDFGFSERTTLLRMGRS